MKKTLLTILLSALFLIPEFASAQRQILITSEPSDAVISINGAQTMLKTPAVIKNPGGQSFTLGLSLDGYPDGTLVVSKEERPLEDSVSVGGKIKSFSRKIFKKKSYPKQISYSFLRAGHSVSRDNPGATELEQTIIRWLIDSDPQGARIFYRVISSVPDEVKNTNESYLMTTPYEETRSFNILGLTYENARDVQIEFKILKPGYEPQVKRFNVRQAIDQQEISSFFMLVPKE